ncbi:unnamed protein product, partial [Durusdinium trenchii]
QDGYFLTKSFKCRPFHCDATTAGCTTCRPRSELTKDGRLYRAGVAERIGDLEQLENCQTCRETDATDDHQFLVDREELGEGSRGCEPFACHTGPLEACQRCKALEERIQEGHCESCNPGFQLLDGRCQAFSCATGPGSACQSCQLLQNRTEDHQCLSCNRGFKLTHDFKCIPFKCEEGSDEKCRICTQQEARSADGYYLTMDLQCSPFTCDESETFSGPKCRTCRPQSKRTGEQQCNTCNDGYGLVNDTCKPFTCTPGPGAGCKACKSQMSMTGFGQCAACNDGYTLTSESTCQLGSENWASNSKVLRYAKQVVRDLVRHLDRNLDGTIDSKELNEEEINAAIQRGIAGCAG